MVAVQKKMDVIYQSQSDTYSKRVELFEGNMNAYALIYGVYCSSYDMKSKVDDAVAIDGTINNDPIKLLETIRSLMQERTSTSYYRTATYVTTTNQPRHVQHHAKGH
jgi:hypothetical protein